MAENLISLYTKSVIDHGTADEAMSLMTLLREEALRLDRHLADPRHKWNRIDTKCNGSDNGDR